MRFCAVYALLGDARVPEAEEGRARGPESRGEPPGGLRSAGARMGEPGWVLSPITPAEQAGGGKRAK